MKRIWSFCGFVILLTLFCPSVFGGGYAVDKGSNIFGITAGLVNASGDLYEDGEGNSSLTLLIMPSIAHFFIPQFALGGICFC